MVISRNYRFIILSSFFQKNVLAKNSGRQWLILKYQEGGLNTSQLLILSILLPFEKLLFPFAYVLFDTKSEAAYNEVFTTFTLLPILQIEGSPVEKPKFISTDFEMGLLNSIKEVFGPKYLIGCFFHYSQALWKKANEMKLRK